MDKSELAQLALRLYCDKGFWHNELARRIITKGDYSQVLRYELGNENTIKNDVETLRELTQTYGGLYIDLYSLEEIERDHIFVPISERSVYNARYDAAMRQRLGDSLYEFITAIVECRLPIPSFFDTDLKELCSLSRYKYAMEHNLDLALIDNETSEEPLPEFSEPFDLSTDDGQEPVTEQDTPFILSPLNEPNTGIRYTRAYSGKI